MGSGRAGLLAVAVNRPRRPGRTSSPPVLPRRWLHTLVQLAPRQLLPHAAELLQHVLPCLGHAGKPAGGQPRNPTTATCATLPRTPPPARLPSACCRVPSSLLLTRGAPPRCQGRAPHAAPLPPCLWPQTARSAPLPGRSTPTCWNRCGSSRSGSSSAARAGCPRQAPALPCWTARRCWRWPGGRAPREGGRSLPCTAMPVAHPCGLLLLPPLLLLQTMHAAPREPCTRAGPRTSRRVAATLRPAPHTMLRAASSWKARRRSASWRRCSG